MKTDTLTYSFLALRDKLYTSALGFLKNDEDAKDALQDTFFNLWRAGKIQTEIEARNKLFAVLRNVCINSLKKPQTFPLGETNLDRLKVNPDSYEDIEEYESLLITGLTDIQRRIYSMVMHDGIEYENIAETLNMSVEAVRMNMSRARKKISNNYKQLNR